MAFIDLELLHWFSEKNGEAAETLKTKWKNLKQYQDNGMKFAGRSGNTSSEDAFLIAGTIPMHAYTEKELEAAKLLPTVGIDLTTLLNSVEKIVLIKNKGEMNT